MSVSRYIYGRRLCSPAVSRRSEAVSDAGADHRRVEPGIGLDGPAIRPGEGFDEYLFNVEVREPVPGDIVVEPCLNGGTDSGAVSDLGDRRIVRVTGIEERDVQ